jgi:fumarylacetoacetase
MDAAGLLATPRPVFDGNSLNALMALDHSAWQTVRGKLSDLLSADSPTLRNNASLREQALVPARQVQLHMPVRVRGYTDFYSSRVHATNVGAMFRDSENALMPNWLHIPIGYNGRASAVIVSGTDIVRPLGQTRAVGGCASNIWTVSETRY